MPVASFFGELDGTENADQFRRLRGTLEERLSDVRVFRVGERRVEVYLMGRNPAGGWVGLHTVSVET